MESSILNAVGVWFYSRNTNRFLYLLRNDPRHPYHWGLAGGKVEKNETLLATIDRECCEELGSMPYCTHLVESGVWPKPMHPGLWNTVNFDVVQHKLEIIMSRLDVIGVQQPLQ